MKVRIILRSALICLLGAVFCGSSVYAGNDLPVNEHVIFTEPSSVKDMLDLLGKLNVAGVMPGVIRDIRVGIKSHLYLDESTDSLITESLTEVLGWIPEFRQKLLKDPDQYGVYSDFDPSEGSLDKCVDTLSHWLPVLHHELWFLYFQIGTLYSHLGGGWQGQTMGQSHGTTQFHRWLISKGFTPDLLRGSEGQQQGDSDEQTDYFAGIHSYGESLNYAQYGLFLLSSTWHESNLASAVLFLQEFCRQVNEADGIFKDKMSDEKYAAVKSVCAQLSGRLLFLTDTLHPLHDGSDTLYKDRLKVEALHSYVDWLLRSLSGLVSSLGQMLSESPEWTRDVFNNAGSDGPFRYGFVFKDSGWDSESFQCQLKAAIDCLAGPATEESLEKLKEHLQKTSGDGQVPDVSSTMGTLEDLAGSLEGLQLSDGSAVSSGNL